MKTKRLGYTLTELLVVIVIIGVIASLLIVAVHKARMAAADAQCVNNVKQLTFSVLQEESRTGYITKNGIYDPKTHRFWCFFGWLDMESNVTPNPSSSNLFQDNPSILICPVWYCPRGTKMTCQQDIHYGMNDYFGIDGKKQLRHRAASQTYMLSDTAQFWGNEYQGYLGEMLLRVPFKNQNGDLTPSTHFRHPGKQAVVSFMDGHVEHRVSPDGKAVSFLSMDRLHWTGTER